MLNTSLLADLRSAGEKSTENSRLATCATKKEKTILLLGMASAPVVKIASPSCTGERVLPASSRGGHFQILMQGSPRGDPPFKRSLTLNMCSGPTAKIKKKNESINSPCQ